MVLDPMLADNGGPTLTHALVMGSEAIDSVPSGVCAPLTDQRDVTRPQALACDSGAFEAVDSDNDNVVDVNDAFPSNPNEQLDSDMDGMGDNFEIEFGLNPNDSADAALDSAGDGKSNLEEFELGTDPRVDENGPDILELIIPIITARPPEE
jgi:hypothetical protein